MTSNAAESTWCFDMTTTNSGGAMWPSTTAAGGAGTVTSEFSGLSLQDSQGSVGSAQGAGSSWAAESSGPDGAQRPNNLGSLGAFGNGSPSGSGSGPQSGTPSGAQPQSNLWSTPFMQQPAVAGGGWNAPGTFSQTQGDASDASGTTTWSQQRQTGSRTAWGEAKSELSLPSPTGTQSDMAIGSSAATSQNVALSVQTQGTANGGPLTNNSNGAGASFIRKYPRVSFEDLEENVQKLINTHDGWGRMPVDQKSGWNVEAIMEQRNRLAEQLEQREAEQRVGAAAAAAPAGESNIWTNEPNTGTNVWEQSREPAASSGQSNAPYWAGTSRQNSAFGNDQSWRGNWDERSTPAAPEAPALHRSASSSAAPGGNGSRGLQHWNSTNEYQSAQRGGAPPRGQFGAQADFSSQNFGQPGSIGVWGEEDGGTGAAQWGTAAPAAADSQGRYGNGPPQRSNAPAAQTNWQAGSQPSTPLASQFSQQPPFPGAQRKGSGWNERGEKVDDGTGLWSGNRGAPQGAAAADWGNSTETGVWDAGVGPAAGPKRSGSESAEWDAEQPTSGNRMWGGQDGGHSDFNDWQGGAGEQKQSSDSWGRGPKGGRSQFTSGPQAGPNASYQSNAGPSAASNYDQNSGGGYQRAKLLSRLTAQGFSREEAQAALIRNNMDYDRTLSELNRQRIQSGIPVGLPPLANASAPVRGQLPVQHDAGLGGAFGSQFDAPLNDPNAMILADLIHKQGGAPNSAFMNNPNLFNQLGGVGAGASANALAVQQKLIASGVQVAPAGARGPQPQSARLPMANSSQGGMGQQLPLGSNLPMGAQQSATTGNMSQIQALSQLPPTQMAIVQQYVKLNAQLQQLQQQQRSGVSNLPRDQLNSYIEKLQTQLKLQEQQLVQMQSQQRFGSAQPQKQPGAQPASRLNQWISEGDAQAASNSGSAFAGLTDSIPEFVPGKPWPGVQYPRDMDNDLNANVAQQRLAMARQQPQASAQPQMQNASYYLLLRNVTQTTDMAVLRQVAGQFGKVTNFVPVMQLGICVIAYATRGDAEKARVGLAPLATRGIGMELLTDPELARVLQQATNAQQAAGAQRPPGADRTGTPTGSNDSGLLPNGLLNS